MSMFNLVVDDTMNVYDVVADAPAELKQCECEHDHCRCVETRGQHLDVHIALNPDTHTTYVWAR